MIVSPLDALRRSWVIVAYTVLIVLLAYLLERSS